MFTCVFCILMFPSALFGGGTRLPPFALPSRSVVLSPDNGRSPVAEAFDPEIFIAPGIGLYGDSAGVILDAGFRFFPADLVTSVSFTFERASRASFETTLFSAGASIGIPLVLSDFFDPPGLLETARVLPYAGAGATWRAAEAGGAESDSSVTDWEKDGFLATFSLGFDADVELSALPGARAGFRLDWRGSAGSVPFMRVNPSLVASWGF